MVKLKKYIINSRSARTILHTRKILDGELTSDSYGMIVKKGNTELLETVTEGDGRSGLDVLPAIRWSMWLLALRA